MLFGAILTGLILTSILKTFLNSQNLFSNFEEKTFYAENTNPRFSFYKMPNN